MKYIGQNQTSEVYEDNFEGHIVRFYKDKLSGEVSINADDAIRAMGLSENLDTFLSSDTGLDAINDYNKEFPDKNFFGNVIREQGKIY